jgi:hypothetical protein
MIVPDLQHRTRENLVRPSGGLGSIRRVFPVDKLRVRSAHRKRLMRDSGVVDANEARKDT